MWTDNRGETMIDQAKMVMKLKKAQKELQNELVEVTAGDGAVIVQVSGELKLKKVTIDPEMVDLDDIEELERWVEVAIRDAMTKAQELAAEKMKPLMGNLGNLGL
ncbi:MAG TPA: YbaB/EbfC family nucleoid-associated protein [Candidatus Saccharimonadales bacterium]